MEVNQLHAIFAKFGEIITCKIVSDEFEIPNPTDPSKFEKKIVSRGYGYVQFRNPNNSKKAMEILNNQIILGQPIQIQHYRRQREDKDEANTFTNCYIKNLPQNFTDEDLRDLFSEFGTPVSFKVIIDTKYTGSNLFGFCSI